MNALAPAPAPAPVPRVVAEPSAPRTTRRGAVLLAIASQFPEESLNVDAAAEFAQSVSCHTDAQRTKVAKLYRRTGVERRGSVLLTKNEQGRTTQDFYQPLPIGDHPDAMVADRGPGTAARNDRYGVEAPRLALASAANALQQSDIGSDRVTHLVTISCTGFQAPGVDIDLIEGLDLSPQTQRVAVGFMGCHGLINGLRVARDIVTADPDAIALVVSVELCSLHYQYGYDSQRIVSGSIFADGSSAAVVAAGPTALTTRPVVGPARVQSPPSTPNTPDTSNTVQLGDGGSCLIPRSRDAMTWRIGDHGFEMTLAASVPSLIEHHLAGFLNPWLADRGLDIGSIGGWAVHPGGTRILGAVESALSLTPDDLIVSYDVLRQHGNMSSATLGVILGRFIQTNVPKPWAMLGFGPGLEVELMLIG